MNGLWWRCGLSLLFLALAGADTMASEDTPTVRLVWSDPYRLIPWGAEDLFEQVQSLVRDMDVHVDWCLDEPGGPDAGGVSIRVLLRPGTSEELGLRRNAMGAALGRKAPREAVFIFLPNVLRTLAVDDELGPEISPRSRAQIHRALARVIHHELIHAILPRRAHDERGIFSFQLTRRLLLTRKITVEDETIDAFAARLREVSR